MADGRDEDIEQSHHNNDGGDQRGQTAQERASCRFCLIRRAGGCGLGRHGARAAGSAREGHTVEVGDGLRHILGAGDHRTIVILGREVLLHGLGDGTGLFVQRGVPEADAVGQVVIAVGIVGRLHHQQDQHAVVLAGTADAPCVEGFGGVVLGGEAAGVLHGQHPDLRPLALVLQLQVQILDGLGGGAAQHPGIIHHPLIGRQVGQLGFGGKRRRAESRHPHRQHQQQGKELLRTFFHRFHAKGSTSLIPNRPLSRLAGKPPVSFW